MPKEIDGVTYYTKDEIYMDQSQVDKAIQDRVARIEKKPADYDDVKQRLADLKAELETANTTIKQKDTELSQAVEDAKKEARGEYMPQIHRARITNAALKHGFVNPEDAVTFYGDIPDELSNDDIDTRVGEIASERAYLLKTQKQQFGANDVGIGASSGGKPPVEPGLARVEAALEAK